MKIARFFAVIFAVLGILLMLGTAVICFASRDAEVKVLETPDGAVSCSEQLVQAINEGDLTAASGLMYGQPDLGAVGTPTDAVSAKLWEKFREEMRCEASGKLYLDGSDFARNATVTALDIASVTRGVQTRAKTLLEEKVAQATDMAELYDAQNNFREDLIDQVMETALEQALREDPAYVTREVTMKIIYRDGQWWAVPDQALLNAISGTGA